MTVADVRVRWGRGQSTGVPHSLHEALDGTQLPGGQEFCRRLVKFPSSRRLAVIDMLVTLAVAFSLAVVVGGLNPLLVGLSVIAWSFALRLAGAYLLSLGRPMIRTGTTVMRAVIILCAAIAVSSIIVTDLNTEALSVMAMLYGGSTLVTRHVMSRRVARSRGAVLPGTLVRGTAADVSVFLNHLARERKPLFRVIAVQTLDRPVELRDEHQDVIVLPASGSLVQHAVAHEASAVVLLGGQPENSTDFRRMLWRLESRGIGTFLVPVVADLAQPLVGSMGASGIPVLGVTTRDLGAEDGVVKVVVDKALALTALIALLPVLTIAAVAVRTTSKGPVLFRQMRVGRGGREFEMLKFRTMAADAEDRRAEVEAHNMYTGGTLFKVANDPRITRVGRVLRKASVDELPQLINVLRGEMSLVGPRPSLPAEAANYPVDAHRRFCVRPGLTGLWQVSGRSNLDPEEALRLDTHYVEQWSPAMDLAILARTPKAVLSGDGAY